MPPERDLFANFDRMRREIDSLFGDVIERGNFGTRRGFMPRVDVYYTGGTSQRAVVTVELAGVDVEGVGLEIRGRQLVIVGERRAQRAAGRLYQQIEIEHGRFRRTVELGAEVVSEEARASYTDGFLRVEIPLVPSHRVQPQQVPIRSGQAGGGQPR